MCRLNIANRLKQKTGKHWKMEKQEKLLPGSALLSMLWCVSAWGEHIGHPIFPACCVFIPSSLGLTGLESSMAICCCWACYIIIIIILTLVARVGLVWLCHPLMLGVLTQGKDNIISYFRVDDLMDNGHLHFGTEMQLWRHGGWAGGERVTMEALADNELIRGTLLQGQLPHTSHPKLVPPRPYAHQ